MMKLILSLSLIWALSSTAAALVCQTCTNQQCSATEPLTCSSETMCLTYLLQETMCTTASIQTNSSGTSAQQIIKTCAPSFLCLATGSQIFSFNAGVVSAIAPLQCCNTSNCNTGNLSIPVPQPNSLKCFTCHPLDSQCNSQLQCKGVEDRCFKVNVTSESITATFFGCISSNLCDLAANQKSLSFLQSNANITGGLSCCETSLCNGVTTPPTTTPSGACCIRLGMIHLLLGLLIFTLCFFEA